MNTLKKKTALILIAGLLLGISPIKVHGDDLNTDIRIEENKEKEVTFSATFGETYIKAFESEGTYYFILPSGIAADELSISCSKSLVNTTEGELNSDGSLLSLSGDSEKSLTVTDAAGNDYPLVVAFSILPSLSVNLSGTTLEEVNSGSKDIKYPGNHVNLTGTEGMNISADNVELKGRGNSSWTLEKKPYQIKFENKTNVLGLGKAKKWVLLASHDDASFLRNRTAFDIAKSMDMPGTPESAYVDLWIDGEYLGLYLLTQKIDIDSSSVNLKQHDGVLVELDNVYYMSEDYVYDSPLSNSHFVLKEHNEEEDEAGVAAFDYFCDTLGEFESHLYAQEKDWDTISSFIDASSFAKYYLIQEFTENWDAMAGSTYMYKDGADDVIHLGPIWDMGLSLGNNRYQDVNSPWVTNNSHRNTQNTWFNELLKIPEFCELVQETYLEYRDTAFSSSIGKAASDADDIAPSAKTNFLRWPILGKENYVWVGMPFSDSFESNAATVTNWIGDRISYMDAVYSGIHVYYSTHVQTYGWQGFVSDGQPSGTIGLSRRLEAVKIQLGNHESEGGIRYKTHIQGIGWEKDWNCDGELSGTTGQSKRLEAIRIELTGDLASEYDLYYRAHAQGFGWLDWAVNGQSAGTSGYSKRLEALEIVLLPKGSEAPGSTAAPFFEKANHTHQYESEILKESTCTESGMERCTCTLCGKEIINEIRAPGHSYVEKVLQSPTFDEEGLKELTCERCGESSTESMPIYTPHVSYRTHIQIYGDEAVWKTDGEVSGTYGESKRLEAIYVTLLDNYGDAIDPSLLGIEYRTHIQGIGWEETFAVNNEMSGTSGQSKRLEAIQIQLTGALSDRYELHYRVHVQSYGWLGWASDSEYAGTAGMSKRLEGIQIVIVPKGTFISSDYENVSGYMVPGSESFIEN